MSDPILDAIAEQDRQKLQQQVSADFQAFADHWNKRMDHNPVDSQPQPEGWGRGEARIDPVPGWRSRTIAGAAHPPLQSIDPDAHEDVVRRFHIEPEVAQRKRALDENRRRLTQDRADWWKGQ